MCDIFAYVLDRGTCPDMEKGLSNLNGCHENIGIHCACWWDRQQPCCYCAWNGANLPAEYFQGEGPDIQPTPIALPGVFPWRAALGLLETTPVDTAVIEAAFRNRAKTAHPDAGGSVTRFQRLTQAREDGLAWVRKRAL